MFEIKNGLILRPKVDKSAYNFNYYSSDNLAYEEGYDLETRRRKYADVIENIKSYCPSPILDLGCGPGFLVHLLRQEGIKAFGCDISPIALQLARPKTAPFLRLANLNSLPYSNDEFNSSLCFHTLEHLNSIQIEKALDEITRITQQRFYGIIPTYDGIIQRNARLRRQILEDPTHVSIMNRAWWLKQFESRGWAENSNLVKKFDRKNYRWVFVFDKASEC